MSDQLILLFCLIIAIVATISLYLFKAKWQIQYKGDERWQLIQLKANSTANVSHYILVVLLIILLFFIDGKTVLTFQRLTSLVMIYIGCRNLIELIAIVFFDKKF